MKTTTLNLRNLARRFAGLFLGIISLGPLSARAATYAVWDLGTLGGTRSEARGINNLGQIVGYTYNATNSSRAFLWQNSAMSDLGAGAAFGISDAGHVVLVDGAGNYFRWQGGSSTRLGALTNAHKLEAYKVNAAGTVAGLSGTRLDPPGLYVERAVSWTGATPTVLGSSDSLYSRAWNISDSGMIVGQQQVIVGSDTRVHAWVFGGAGDINTLTAWKNSTARAVNDAGQVAGFVFNHPLLLDATPFIWDAAGGMRLLGSSGYSFAQALSINSSGTAVGCAGPSGSAVMWLNAGKATEQLIDLQTTIPAGSGWDLDCAYDINDNGEIVGYGKINGETHGFLLYPADPTSPPRHRIDGRLRLDTHSQHTGVRGTSYLRDARVELAIVTNTPPELVSYATAWTDAQGHFAFLLPTGATHRVSLKFTLRDRNNRFELYDDGNDATSAAWLRTPFLTVSANTTADLKMSIDPNTDSSANETLFSFAGTDFVPAATTTDGAWPDGASNAGTDHFSHLAYLYYLLWDPADFAVRRLGQTVPLIPVHAWDALANNNQFFFRCSDNTIHVAATRSLFNNPVSPATPFSARHEYGHAVQCASPISGVNHIPDLGQIQNHLGIGNTFSSDSWAEGFATWYAAAVAQDLGHILPNLQQYRGGTVDLSILGGARVDDPHQAGFNMTFGQLGEEFAIASILWDVHQRAGLNALWATLRANVPNLETFQDVYIAMTNAPGIAGPLAGLTDVIPQTGATLSGVDVLFVERGFYQDADGDGFYDAGETIGCTRWPNLALNACRADPPFIPSSELLLRVVENGTGAALGDVRFNIRIEYDPPFETNKCTNVWFAAGNPPWRLPITLPGNPSRAFITASKPGYDDSPPLIIESDHFHDRVNPFRDGGVSEILQEHTFTLGLAGFDLALAISQSADPVGVGVALTYTLAVTNQGAATASGVRLTNTLPAGVAFVSAVSSQGVCSSTAGLVACDLGSLAAGASAVAQVLVIPRAAGTLTNSATVAAADAEGNTANNFALATTAVLNPPQILAPVRVDSAFRFSVATETGRSYIVEFKSDLRQPAWRVIGVLTGDGTVQSLTLPINPVGNGFFRVRVQ
jgi:uncharacterized repeat protein (TIGR01451 family)